MNENSYSAFENFKNNLENGARERESSVADHPLSEMTFSPIADQLVSALIGRYNTFNSARLSEIGQQGLVILVDRIIHDLPVRSEDPAFGSCLLAAMLSITSYNGMDIIPHPDSGDIYFLCETIENITNQEIPEDERALIMVSLIENYQENLDDYRYYDEEDDYYEDSYEDGYEDDDGIEDGYVVEHNEYSSDDLSAVEDRDSKSETLRVIEESFRNSADTVKEIFDDYLNINQERDDRDQRERE